MKAVVAAFNQEKALVGAFSVHTNLRMELFQALLVTTPRVSQSGELWWHSPGSCRRSAPPGGAAGADTDSGVTGVTLVTICDDTSLGSCIPSTSVVSAPDYAPSHPLASVTIQTPDSRLQHKNVTVAMNKERSGINWTNLQHGHNSVNTRPCVVSSISVLSCVTLCDVTHVTPRDGSSYWWQRDQYKESHCLDRARLEPK